MARILLIDDELDVRSLLQMFLERDGHTVLSARPGNALLEDLENLQYDAVITDLHMPVLDGWDVATWVRRHRPGTPVLAIGGNVGPCSHAPAGLFAGVLAKPFHRAALSRMIGKAMSPQAIDW